MCIVSERECRQYAPWNGFNLVEEGEGEDRKSVLIQARMLLVLLRIFGF